jgi:hypothetical protein
VRTSGAASRVALYLDPIDVGLAPRNAFTPGRARCPARRAIGSGKIPAGEREFLYPFRRLVPFRFVCRGARARFQSAFRPLTLTLAKHEPCDTFACCPLLILSENSPDQAS